MLPYLHFIGKNQKAKKYKQYIKINLKVKK